MHIYLCWTKTDRDMDIDEIMDVIESREHPLAMYLFTKDMSWANKVMSTHPSTVLKGSTRFNLTLREHPYMGRRILPLLRLLER